MFKWLERRRQEKEFERDVKVRQAKRRILRHVEKQRETEQKLWRLGKRAIQLGDQKQFEQIGKQILWTRDDVDRWERYLLNMETLEARRDQVRATGEFMQSLQAMADSLLTGAKPQDMARIQQDIEMGLARAQDVNERLTLFMEMADDMFYDAETSQPEALAEIQTAMAQDAELDEGSQYDAQIEAGLAKIREQLKKTP